jgi:hypothetical protein
MFALAIRNRAQTWSLGTRESARFDMKKPSTRYNHRLRILHSPTQISRMRSVVYIPVCHSSFPPKLFPTVHAPPPSHHPSSPHQLQYAVQLKYPFVATHLSVTCTVIGSALHLRSFGKSRTIPSRISIPLKHTQTPDANASSSDPRT